MHRRGVWLALVCLAPLPLVGTAACGFDPGCLAEGTLVATPSGDVPIETLRPGDVVYSVDPERGRRHAARIVAVRSHRRACVALTTPKGRTIVATAEHPVYEPDGCRYVAAGRWPDTRPLPGLRRVYDVTVASRFSNFLANGVLVHNKSRGSHDYLGEIENFVSVEDLASGTPAVRVAPPVVNYSDRGLSIRLTLDPDSMNPDGSGPNVVRVEADEPFDALLVEAHTDTHYLAGYLQWNAPAPTTSVDLEVVLTGVSDDVFITMGAWVGSQLGPAAFVELTP